VRDSKEGEILGVTFVKGEICESDFPDLGTGVLAEIQYITGEKGDLKSYVRTESQTKSSVQAENISTVTKAAGVTVEPYWPGLFAKLFEKKSIADLITNVGAGTPPPLL
jgi:hypothetical protein